MRPPPSRGINTGNPNLVPRVSLLPAIAFGGKKRDPGNEVEAIPIFKRLFVVRRYGLRTNSLLLLGLCLGWIFGILSFREVDNVRFQLSFGLINGLQVSEVFVTRGASSHDSAGNEIPT